MLNRRRRQRQKETPLGRHLGALIDEKFNGDVDAAAAAGISPGTINSWMRGGIADPRVATLKQVADALGTSYEDLCRLAVGLEPLQPGTPLPAPASMSAEDRERRAYIEEFIGMSDGLTTQHLREFVARAKAVAAPTTEQRRLDLPAVEPPITRTAPL